MKFAEFFRKAADVGIEAVEGVIDTASEAVTALPLSPVLKADALQLLGNARATLVRMHEDVDSGTGDLVADFIDGTTTVALNSLQLAKDVETEYAMLSAAAANFATMAAQALAKIKPPVQASR